jgi:Na+/proline symporter
MAGFATALFYIGISMTYLYLMMGVIVSSAVIPATLTLMWKRQNVVAATATPILGLFCSLTAWLVTAKRESGSLSVASTYANNPMLTGNVVALLSPVLFVPILTYAFGVDNYDYKSMESIRGGDDSGIAAEANMDLELVPDASNLGLEVVAPDEKAMLKHASKAAKATTAGMTLVLLILWPIPLYASGYVFSKPFFTGWVVASIMWLFFSFCCVGLFPLWQGRQGLIVTFKAIKLDFNTSREARNPHSDNRRGRGHRESLDLSIHS